ncbi:MAG: ABC transporter ATP-binding protein [Acidiferrobacterales bacterium]
MSAIQINKVFKSFPGVQALKGIDLTIEQGEFFGLLGPNGAGKSTLISIIAGLTHADSGQVTVMGSDVRQDYRSARKRIGVVPQELVFDPFFTVREVLRIQAGYFGLGRECHDWLEELMAALKLSDKADTNMRALSGGMKRRVLVGQALVHKPDVVILDEPTAGVDVELRQSLWQFVERLHKEGHTIVLTTHYLEEAESLCDRIAILNHGEIVALDSKDALMAKGIGRRLRLAVTVAERLPRVPESLAGKLLRHEDNSLVLELDRDQDSVVGVIDTLRAAGAHVTDLHTEQADLEDIFVDLIRSGE